MRQQEEDGTHAGEGRKGVAEVFMFLKQSKEMKIPFCLSSSDRRRRRERKALKEKNTRRKEKKEKKIVFLSVDKAGDCYNNYVQIRERRGEEETGFVFAFQSKLRCRRMVPTIGGVGWEVKPPPTHTFRYQLQVSNAKITSKELQITIRRI